MDPMGGGETAQNKYSNSGKKSQPSASCSLLQRRQNLWSKPLLRMAGGSLDFWMIHWFIGIEDPKMDPNAVVNPLSSGYVLTIP